MIARRNGMPRTTVLGERFAVLADGLLLGVMTFVAALPLVTAFAALTAACSVLDDAVAQQRTVRVRDYARRLGAVLRSGAGVLLVPAGAGLVLLVDAAAVVGGMPGAAAFGAVLAVVAGGALLVGLRAAATWAPGAAWREVAAAAAAQARADVGGDVLLVGAMIVTGILVWQTPALVILTPGLLTIAAVATARRGRGL